MSAVKTRERLIDVARQLFNKKGIEKTTMNDIASASDKGRRTIYTYFKNKREIYNAVIERESELLVGALREIAQSPLPPVEKLEKFLSKRFEIIRDTVNNYTRFRSLISFDSKRMQRVQHIASVKINEMLTQMLAQGVNEGTFDPAQVKRMNSMLQATIMGVDACYIQGLQNVGCVDQEKFEGDIIQFITTAITIR